MTISYDIQVEGDLLYVTASGSDESLEEVQAYGAAVVEACREHSCRRVLADERALDYRLSTIDTYDLAKYYSKYVPHVIRAAVVCSPGDLEDGSFWEVAVQNRGLLFRVFTDFEQARAWLKAIE